MSVSPSHIRGEHSRINAITEVVLSEATQDQRNIRLQDQKLRAIYVQGIYDNSDIQVNSKGSLYPWEGSLISIIASFL